MLRQTLAKAEAEKAAALEAQMKKLAVSAAKIISESEEELLANLQRDLLTQKQH